MLEIRVRDTGSGIPAEHLSQIFERFYQVDDFSLVERLHATSLQGTGIGLALVKELVELHHGEIMASSQPGRGSEFVVKLPLGKEVFSQDEILEITDVSSPDTIEAMKEAASALLPQTGRDIPAQPASQKGALIVLIVDDHPDVRYYLRKQLETEYEITEAADGAEGLEIARETIPDLVISDVMMPGMNGQELCKALKTSDKTSHIPVILLTARAGEQDKLAGLETGADDYLIKPFNSQELRIRVHNLIEIRRRLQEHYRKEGLLAPRDLPVTSIEQAFLEKLRTVLEQHLAEEDFGIDILCRELAMSPRQLQRKIRALTDESPTDLIRSARLERAKYLLEQHTGNVSEIAFAVGFNNLSYFARSFRERFGVSPSRFIRHTEQ